jgi:hypothetical protein
MEISDITLVVMGSMLVLGSSAVIIYVNCRCKKPQQVHAIETEKPFAIKFIYYSIFKLVCSSYI